MCATGLILAVVLIVEVWNVGASTEGCPDIVLRSPHFAKVHNGTCYLFVNHEQYWKRARDDCWNMGGEMLSLKDEKTMQFIRSVLNSRQLRWFKQGVWLGASYSRGRWRWTTGNKVEYSNWAPGEPSKLLGVFSVEDCALMRRDDNWKWHDYICGSLKYHYNYICEFPFNQHGRHQAHSASLSLDNGNMAILTIILVTGGIVLLVLLLVFLIFRRRYNYKKAMGQPAVHFENRNYNHAREPLPPPPAPHSSHPRPSSDLYLTPVEVGAMYEEVQKPNGVATHMFKDTGSYHSSPSATLTTQSDEMLGACGGMPATDLDNASTPLVSAAEGAAFLGQSEESLHSMSGSLTQKISNVHNDYVDMNGSPVVPPRGSHDTEPAPKLEDGKGLKSKDSVSSSSNGSDGMMTHKESKQPLDPGYSNLTTSQDRCENLYEHLP